MRVYTVHENSDYDDERRVVLVKEGFCWPALFVSLLWTLYRRLWLVFLILLAAILLLSVLGEAIGTAAFGLFILGRVFYGLEANGLRRWTLERNGYTLVGVIEGRTLIEAERRFFDDWEPDAPTAYAPPPPAQDTAPATAASRTGPWKSASTGPQIVGLFPAPGSGR